MHVDHLIHAAGPDGLDATAERLARALGTGWTPGGRHPSWGTRNAVIPLAAAAYLEIVEAVDPQIALGTPFGSAVVAASQAGGGWIGWVVAVDDVAAWASRLGRPVVTGTRERPDGTQLRWRTLASEVLRTDPDLPFLITWDVPDDLHPSASVPALASRTGRSGTGSSGTGSSGTGTVGTGTSDATADPRGPVRLTGVELTGDRVRLAAWLGEDPGVALGGEVDVDVIAPAPGARPGLHAATFATPQGAVRLA